MTTTVHARVTAGPNEPFTPTRIERRDPGAHDVAISIHYTGVCHSDVSHARSEWGHNPFPLVPGHEIAGIVTAVGSAVTRFEVGARVGVGCLVDSCRECRNCLLGHEEQCIPGNTKTYGSTDRDGTPTYGGYSEAIVVNEDFVLALPDGIPLENAAPLLCAGVTVFAPLKRWGAGHGKRVGIVGLGGLGHLAVRLASAMGAEVTVFDLAANKESDARALGAQDFFTVSDPQVFRDLAQTLDLIISTVPANVDLDAYLGLLLLDGVYVSIGVPSRPLTLDAFSVIVNRRAVAGSRIGSIAETQELLDFCGVHGIGAEIELIDADQIDVAFDRLVKGDVRFRFVLDTATLAPVEPVPAMR
ncbi:NAD(P)-dependent alcohol dehydrogenase [Microbacterium aoyamense]|uniref:alcohol dehydrogenase (NADP(+)) n=1 Tax=Microbacterium aoyamense TaxID=344166 RepID=A0ABP5AQG2_9MICO|nr:NAD(P)-dependent alcohol dehydrogenase [Microbacterium aoyamense]